MTNHSSESDGLSMNAPLVTWCIVKRLKIYKRNDEKHARVNIQQPRPPRGGRTSQALGCFPFLLGLSPLCWYVTFLIAEFLLIKQPAIPQNYLSIHHLEIDRLVLTSPRLFGHRRLFCSRLQRSCRVPARRQHSQFLTQ